MQKAKRLLMLAIMGWSNANLLASHDGFFFLSVVELSVKWAEFLWKKLLFCRGLEDNEYQEEYIPEMAPFLLVLQGDLVYVSWRVTQICF